MTQSARVLVPAMLLTVTVAFTLREPRVASATPIQFRMTGKIDVTYQVGPLPAGIYQDAPFEAILSYDLATPDSQPDDPSRGYYRAIGDDVNYLLIRAGTSQIRSKDGLTLWVGNDVDEMHELFESQDDTFAIRDAAITANIDISRFSLMVFHWNDPTRTVFSSDSLPTFLDPMRFTKAFDSTVFTPPYIEVRTFQIDPRVYQFTIHAFVESIEVVPEPASRVIAFVGALLGSVYAAVRSGRFVFLRRT
jgi:hypothetical protein